MTEQFLLYSEDQSPSPAAACGAPNQRNSMPVCSEKYTGMERTRVAGPPEFATAPAILRKAAFITVIVDGVCGVA